MSDKAKRYLFYWLSWCISILQPLVYFIIKSGVTKKKTTLVFPVVFISVYGVIKLASDIPQWVSTWQPSFKKGLIKAIPKFLLLIVLITLGVCLQYMITKQVKLAFSRYYETVLVFFGSVCLGSIVEAYHLKYKELYLLSKGYVLGVVNK